MLFLKKTNSEMQKRLMQNNFKRIKKTTDFEFENSISQINRDLIRI
ncbi:MAG: hypothetical protein Ct9H90mP3_0920 [Flammeovirgaceae bacterium]|nr:MAG: hypothetical protein Ct9H90mP3_0920 [Flammeovirgaceae bacterium]